MHIYEQAMGVAKWLRCTMPKEPLTSFARLWSLVSFLGMHSAVIPSKQVDSLQPGTASIVICGFLPNLAGERLLQLENCEKISVVAISLCFMETFLCAFGRLVAMTSQLELDAHFCCLVGWCGSPSPSNHGLLSCYGRAHNNSTALIS